MPNAVRHPVLKVRGLCSAGTASSTSTSSGSTRIMVLARALNAVVARVRRADQRPVRRRAEQRHPGRRPGHAVVRPQGRDRRRRSSTEIGRHARGEYQRADRGIRMELEPSRPPRRRCSPARPPGRFARLTALIPNGVLSWSLRPPASWSAPTTSAPCGPSRRLRAGVTITAQVTSRKHEVLDRIRALAALAGDGVTVEQFGLDAPEFPYQENSELLKTAAGGLPGSHRRGAGYPRVPMQPRTRHVQPEDSGTGDHLHRYRIALRCTRRWNRSTTPRSPRSGPSCARSSAG